MCTGGFSKPYIEQAVGASYTYTQKLAAAMFAETLEYLHCLVHVIPRELKLYIELQLRNHMDKYPVAVFFPQGERPSFKPIESNR
jgi:hypothetical protein